MTPKPTVMGIVSRHRPNELRRCVTSAVANAQGPLRVAIAFDDDLVSQEMCPHWSFARTINLSPRHYYVRGKNAVYRMARSLSEECEYYVMSNDDSEWVRPGWLESAQNTLEEHFDDGMGILELFMAGHCAHYITKFKFVDEYLNGRLGDPRFTMYFSDTDMLLRMQEIKRYGSIMFDGDWHKQYHNHIVNHQLDAKGDHTAYEVQSTWWERDEEIFNELHPKEEQKEP